MDGSGIRKEKVAGSKISGYVWTGPEYFVTGSKLNLNSLKRLMIHGDF